jgi:murein L,D-transpeptidase YcbB/YkuD
MKITRLCYVFVFIFFCNAMASCSNPKNNEIPSSEMNVAVQNELRQMLDSLQGKSVNDSTQLFAPAVLQYFYNQTSYQPIWSNARSWNTITDSLLGFVQKSQYYGLIKEDYQCDLLMSIKSELDNDSLKLAPAYSWARAELLFTDALVHIFQDIKQGRLQHDSLTWINLPAKRKEFFMPLIQTFMASADLKDIAADLEPAHKGYQALKKALEPFVVSMNNKRFTYIQYPYKDSILFITKFKQRMKEGGLIANASTSLDSNGLASLVSKYQESKQLKVTGKISAALVNLVNNTDLEKFYRVAITLDKYKQMHDAFPNKYIMVNLPAYQLRVWDNDIIALESKVIIGKTATPTPHITSAISNLVIYPTWTVPNSIIVAELLPGLKKNPGHLAKKGLGLYTYKGEPVNPDSIDWTKYSKNIPYLVRQSSGDNNALGIIKFNFSNPYDVYLHDTNQRYLFKNKNRSLSHGCVRVEEWQKLAFYIARNDSVYNDNVKSYNTDSLLQWLGEKTYRMVAIKKKLPLYILYFSVEPLDGKLVFFEDVYGEDKAIREKYFALR